MSLHVIAFDILGTLFDTAALKKPLAKHGFPPPAGAAWVAKNLRDGFAGEVAGLFRPYREVALSTLAVLASEYGLKLTAGELEELVEHFSSLPAFSDVQPGLERAQAAGFRVFALSNGSINSTTKLLNGAKLDGYFERIVSIDEVRHWKPARQVYDHCVALAGVPASEMALVAAHAWDTAGAAQAGLLTAWVQREEKIYAPAMPPADFRGETMEEVVAHLELRRRTS